MSESTPYVHDNGDVVWMNSKRQRHRLDRPAIDRADGSKAWYVNGKLHRLDGPAYEGADGSKLWWVEGWTYAEERWRQKVAELLADKKKNNE